QCHLTFHRACGIAQQLSRYRRCQDNIVAVMGHDCVEVVRVPGFDPMLGETVSFVLCEHGWLCKTILSWSADSISQLRIESFVRVPIQVCPSCQWRIHSQVVRSKS